MNHYHLQEFGLLWVTGNYMKNHLRPVIQGRYRQNKLLFEMIHTSLGYYHIRGRLVVENDKNMILALLENVKSSIIGLFLRQSLVKFYNLMVGMD